MHDRRSIRLKGYDYTQSGIYYVTICVRDRECVLGEITNGKMLLNDYGRIVDEEWHKSEEIREIVELDCYQIMPNHLHGIIKINKGNVRALGPIALTPRLEKNSLGSIIGQFKSVATKRIRKTGLDHFKWQRNYYERIIRNYDEINRIRKYIFENPLKWEMDEHNINNSRK